MFVLNTAVGAPTLGRDLPANLMYLTRGPVFPSTLPFENNLPSGLHHLVQSPSSSSSLWSRFMSVMGKAPVGQQFLAWGGIGGLVLNMFMGTERSFFGNILNFGLSVAGIASLFVPGLALPVAAIYAARGLFTMATGGGLLTGLLDLACAFPVYGMWKNWGNISQAATRLAERTGISTVHTYSRAIAKYSFGPGAGRQVSQIGNAFSRNPRETLGNIAESTGRGLSYYSGRFMNGARSATTAVSPAPALIAGAGI